MIHCVGDLSLFLKHINEKLAVIAGTYVDDSILAGREEFKQRRNKTSTRFDSKKSIPDNSTFAGIEISTVLNGFRMHQRKQIQKIRVIPAEAS